MIFGPTSRQRGTCSDSLGSSHAKGASAPDERLAQVRLRQHPSTATFTATVGPWCLRSSGNPAAQLSRLGDSVPVLCFLPQGVASIVFAAQVNSKWAMGDVAGAQASSAKAKKFAIWAAIAWAIVAVLYLVSFCPAC